MNKQIKHYCLVFFCIGYCCVCQAEIWPAWVYFKNHYIAHGRVIDNSFGKHISTSEGQSYAMFFAICAGDRDMFDELLKWTQQHLAKGDLSQHIPSWLWGKNKQGNFQVLDENYASDSALWIAYDLLEAARLWQAPSYQLMAKGLLNKLYDDRQVVPKLGEVILPGGYGFAFEDYWRLNPSYYPPQLMLRLANFDRRWHAIYQTSLEILKGSSPYGIAPDWVVWQKDKGWQADKIYPNRASYDAIRVYLWVGLLAESKIKKSLSRHFQPMLEWVKKYNKVPEEINILTSQYSDKGPLGFYAALAPLLPSLWQRERLSLQENDYYNAVLTLFADGYITKKYRFNQNGTLGLDNEH